MWLLLAEAALIDHRTVTEEIVAEWSLVIPEDVTVEEARAALLEHRREAPGVYLEPGHIVQLVRAGRAREGGPLVAERAALARFAAYTGIPREVAAARWSDRAWVEAETDAARKAHKQAAIGGRS